MCVCVYIYKYINRGNTWNASLASYGSLLLLLLLGDVNRITIHPESREYLHTNDPMKRNIWSTI